MKLKFILSFFIMLYFSSCTRYPREVQVVLQRMNAENRTKFEAIFEHYRISGEELKLQACYFMVTNMQGLGYYNGKQLRDYNILFEILRNKPDDYRENLPWYSNELVNLFDSLNSIYGQLSFRNLHFVDDLSSFSQEAFIRYIDNAFLAWEQLWSKKAVGFSDFCNYVLPYRNFQEPLQDWREMYTSEYSWIHDSVTDDRDIIEVARLLNIDSELKYSNGFGNYIVSIAPEYLIHPKYGTCADNSNHKAMIMRAHGIPVAIDFLPQYGTDHNSHYWNAILTPEGSFESFGELLDDINARVAYKYRIGKVYRKTFTQNPALIKHQQATDNKRPDLFNDTKFVDVTHEYVEVSDAELTLDTLIEGQTYVYAAVFDNVGWVPISYAPLQTDRKVTFTQLGHEVIYLPVFCAEGQIIPAAQPFLFRKDKTLQMLKPNTDTFITVELSRKYHFENRKRNWLRCLHHGVFEGANRPDFSDAIQLASIDAIPGEHYVTLESESNRKFRYLRFVFSADEQQLSYDGDGASMAEIEFISANGKLIKGQPLGTTGRKYNPYTPDKCFDGNPLSFYEDARYTNDVKFVGLELGAPVSVHKIRFLPRNDMNSIQTGDRYELLFWDKSDFTSLGYQTAEDTLLIYTHVPSEAVLLLKNHSSGKEERIFTWEEGKQVWY